MNLKTKRKELIKKIALIFIPYTDGILVEGSGAWGNIELTRDIDLEFVTPNFDFFKRLNPRSISINNLSETIEIFTSKVLNRVLMLNLEMFDLKIFPNGQEISIRFTKSVLFNKICHLEFEKINKTKSILQYRLFPTKPLNIQKNFFGEGIRYKRWCFSSEKQQLIETPIVIVDARDRFYPGEIIDRWLAFPKIVYEKNSFCKQNLEKLKVGIVKRLMFEEKRSFPKTKPSLSLCLSRKERIPEKLLNQLNKEESEIRLQIKNEVSHNE